MRTKIIVISFIACIATAGLLFQNKSFTTPKANSAVSPSPSSDIWQTKLTKEQYHILREKGTEVPFTGSLLHESRAGTYYSYGCEKPLFRSEQKFDSGTGWPSFWEPIQPDAVQLVPETGFGDTRTEVQDACGGHLGHVFDDGPAPTGKRYCMNSVALYFVPDSKDK